MSAMPLAEDLMFTGPVASFRDAAGFRAMAAQAGAAVRSLAVRHQFAADDLVCSVIDWEMDPAPGMMTSAEVLTIRGGKIVRGELIYDGEQLRRAMAQSAAGEEGAGTVAYDTAVAARVRALLPTGRVFQEKAMFGGLAFLLGGRMCAGVVDARVVLWLGRQGASAAIAEQPAAAPMDFTGRVMHNFVYLEPGAVPDDAELRRWLDQAVAAVIGRDA